MKMGQNAITVLENRYLTRDDKGNLIETPEELFRRVAKHIATGDNMFDKNNDIEKLENEFYDLMANLEFLPNSPTLMNAGKELGQLSACFVLPVEDSMEGIFDAIKNAALIHKSGGGTGFSFSRLRSAGSSVKSTGGVASGPISFMKVFNSATEAVKQGGTRRGANMGILKVNHPDILEFIECKKDTTEITNFNISIGLTEEFMKSVEEDKPYELINPNTELVVGRLRAKEVFDRIIDMAWNNGEPGIVFLDRINNDNPVPNLGEVESTNPCGEQPLLPYESCNLGSINLNSILKKSKDLYELDYEKLGYIVEKSVHFLDNVIEVNKYPLEEIDEMTKKTRKIGLGVMGFADILFKLKIPYNSQSGVDLAKEIMEFIDDKSKQASEDLAKERGVFPAYVGSTYEKKGIELRNATTTTIAPTGTISIISGSSSGVEPLFAISFVRNVMDNEKLVEVHPYFEQVARERGFYSKELMEKIAEEGTIAHMPEVPKDIRDIFVTAHDISPEWHIKMQAAFQSHVDNAVSKTVNFKRDATKEDVREVYNLAYKLGCKGITMYRDGSRDSQVLSVGKQNDEEKGIQPRQRPELTQGATEKFSIGCGSLYVTANYDEEGICEVFTNVGRAGGCPSQSEATSRVVSVALRAGMDPKFIIEQLKGIRCHSTLRQRSNNKDIKVLSCPDAIGKALEKVLKTYIDVKDSPTEPMELDELKEDYEMNYIPKPTGNLNTSAKCPECNAHITHESGCVICPSCGFSKCG